MKLRDCIRFAARTVATGSIAALTSTAALALAARMSGKSASQPLNATSHWLHGEAAADVTGFDLPHTAVGYATHHAATIFWAALFEIWMERRPARSTTRLLIDASAMSAFAAAVDYIATPKRFTPGWEYVLTKRAMAAGYAAMAAGLALGVRVQQRQSS